MIGDPNDPNDPYAAYRQRFPGAPLPPGAGAPPAPGASVPPQQAAPPAPPTAFAPNPQPSPGIGQPAPNPNGIDPNVAKLMINLGGRSADQLGIQRQQKMADMMRGNIDTLNAPGHQLRGGQYVGGPNAGTAIASGLMGYMSGRAQDKAEAQAGTMDKSRNKAMRGYFKNLTGVDSGNDEEV